MTSFRFIHAADLHLDTPFSGMSGVPERLRQYLQGSTFSALGDLVDLAISEEVDFIVISGDIYDASDSSLRAQLRLREAWDKLGQHGIPVFLIHGNHDPLNSRRLRLAHPPHVTVFGAKMESAYASRRSDGQTVAVVSGISYPTAAVMENTSRQFHRDSDSKLYHIGLLHANVDGQEGHDAYSPCSLRDLANTGYDYWALGHIHKRQILSQSPWIIYPGNIQGRSLKETGPKGCYVVDVDEHGVTHPVFHELDYVRWNEIEISIEGLISEEDWKDAVEDKLQELRRSGTGRLQIVRMVFTGRGPLHKLLQSGRESGELLQELRRRENQRLEEKGTGIVDMGSIVWVAGFKVATGMDIDTALLLQEDSFLGELFRLVAKAEGEQELLGSIVDSAMTSLMDNSVLRGLLKEEGPQQRLDLLRRAQELASSLLVEEDPRGGVGQ
ncbi:metallophosphoesterase family protein [Paenibacillus segetis]|uniref:Exonuclease SbcCD subunit D n=1 Tax=Paenibacillus segetis TaxID=1325360 RepID=A0ABQ1Y940_9BACL|nr:DNA repair exonuclease [Paenibacillus segetis]GGH16010.1 exonuclease SbcCD subunit D [Paenibacillus segetis]